MNKENYIKIIDEKLDGKAKQIMLDQINNYYSLKNYKLNKNNYKIGDDVFLEKGTLLHGTFKNIDGLREILKDGLISSWFVDGRLSKYPSSVGVWNLKQDCFLKDYINLYSGGTIQYYGLIKGGVRTDENIIKLIPYDKMNNLNDELKNNSSHLWKLEQTKEARFMPSLAQDNIQIGIIFQNNAGLGKLLRVDVLSDVISDEDVKPFINEDFYEDFLYLRRHKDALFTDRESAILFGIPSNFIEGILVGRLYEKDNDILKEIKELLPDCYICNLDGKIIM